MKIVSLRAFAFIASTAFLSCTAFAQVDDAPDGNIAGIPVNYTEAKVGNYTLPDPLVLAGGQPVKDAATWTNQRRPEILKDFETQVYGRIPVTAPKVTWEVVSTDRNALGGAAILKQLAGHMGGPDGPVIHVNLYTPANATGPVPVLIGINFGGNVGVSTVTPGPNAAEMRAVNQTLRTMIANTDPAAKAILEKYPNYQIFPVPPATPPAIGGAPIAELIAHGFGYATLGKDDIETDTQNQANVNIARKLALAPGQTAPAPDEWGTIASWAWGLSRVVDYLETDSAVDAKRIAIMGVSRLGKTVLWAGANDPRIALVIASCSGEGGAALARRNYGETIAHLVEPTRYPYQFAGNYAKYGPDPKTMPVDAHMLVALMAPRPVLLQTGDTDRWSDPRGEFMSANAAEPVYKLFGKQGLGTEQMPQAGQPIMHDIGYYMHAGGHGTLPGDWPYFIQFMELHFKPAPNATP